MKAFLALVSILVLLLSGCLAWKSNAPAVSILGRELVGEQSTFMPDSDGQYQKEATNSAQLDNLNDLAKLASALVESGIDPAAITAAANGDAQALQKLADNEKITPAQLREAQRFLATCAVTKGLVNINNNSAGVDRTIAADVTAAITEALRAAVTATQRESTSTESTPDASGGPSIPVTVSPVP